MSVNQAEQTFFQQILDQQAESPAKAETDLTSAWSKSHEIIAHRKISQEIF